MSEQARDEHGRFTGDEAETLRGELAAANARLDKLEGKKTKHPPVDYEPMNQLLRDRQRFRARLAPETPPENRKMNELLLRATGRLPVENDEPNEAA